jgi:CrcB protein
MTHYWLIGLGSGLGGMARYACTLFVQNFYPTTFPLGTLLINVVGSFLIALIATGATSSIFASEESRLFATTGFLGGFTTFSAFSLQTIQLLKSGQAALAIAYIFSSVLVCLAAAWLAFAIAR